MSFPSGSIPSVLQLIALLTKRRCPEASDLDSSGRSDAGQDVVVAARLRHNRHCDHTSLYNRDTRSAVQIGGIEWRTENVAASRRAPEEVGLSALQPKTRQPRVRSAPQACYNHRQHMHAVRRRAASRANSEARRHKLSTADPVE